MKVSLLNSPGRSKPSLVALALLSLSFAVVYHEIIWRTVKGWGTFAGSYGVLIAGISGYMLWCKRKKIAATEIAPSFGMGGLLTFGGLGVFLISKLSHTLILQGVALIITVLGLVLLVLGFRQFRILFIPVGYLVFLFSFFEEVLGSFSIHLQTMAAWIAARMLALTGMPVFLQGEYIELPHITLEVAKVCNGVNHIVALVALAIPLAFLSRVSFVQKIGIIVFALATGIFANGLRVALIGLWTINHHGDSIHGPFELLYVTFIFIFGGLLFGIVGLITRGKGAVQTEGVTQSATDGMTFIQRLKTGPMVLALTLLLAVSLYLNFYTVRPVPLTKPLQTFPQTVHQWQGRMVADPDWPFKFVTGDSTLKRIYRRAGAAPQIGLLVSYYADQTQDKELINHRLMWLHLKARPVAIDLNGRTVTINRGLPRGLASQTFAGDKRIFYFWYYMDGRIYTDPLKVKLHGLLSALFKRRNNAAMIAISSEKPLPDEAAADQEIIPFIQAIWSDLDDVLTSR